MQFKKIVAFIVLLCMLAVNTAFSVSAQSVYEFDAENYTAYRGYMNVNKDGKPVPGNGMGNNTSVTYENVYVEESALYKLSAELIGAYGKDSKILVFYDGVEVLCSSIPLTDRYALVELGEIPLTKGNNKLTFKVIDTESVYFTKFMLEKTGKLTTFIRNGDSADRQSEEGITDNKPSEGMNTGRYAEYDINISEDGFYKLSFDAATVSEACADVLLTVDSEAFETVHIIGGGWYSPVKKEYGTLYLSKGVHTFNITVAAEAIRLFSITVTGMEKAVANEFIADVKKANLKSLPSVFEEYDGKLINSYKDLLSSVVYKDFCYRQILSIETEDFSEFDNTAMQYIKEEIQNPLVYVMQNGEKVPSISEGEFEIVFSEKFKEQLSVTAALFDVDKNQLKAVKSGNIVPGEDNSIKRMVSDGKSRLSLFFWKDADRLQAGNLPLNNSYIYVAPYGNDNAKGTFDSPVKTVNEAAMRVNSLEKTGDVTVNMLPGEYFIKDTMLFDEKSGGTDEFSVVYKSYDSENPAVITGGKRVDGWEYYRDGIYFAKLGDISDVRQLYINGLPAVRARSKAVFYGNSYWDDEATEYTEDGFFINSSTFPDLAKPQDAEICYNILWTLQRLPVKDVLKENDVITVKMDQPYYSQAVTMLCEGGIQPGNGTQLFVENDINLLDEEGEFYFDKDEKVIYYYPFEEEILSESDCVVSVTEKLFEIKGSSDENKIKNLSFENIDFCYGAYISANTTGTVSFQAECLSSDKLNVNPVDSATAKRLSGQIEIENAQDISFVNCDISCMGSSAVVFKENVENSSVTGCLFRDNGGSAVSIGEFNLTGSSSPENTAKNICVENNVITRQGSEFMFCPAVSVYYANSIKITNNTICDTPYSGISLGWGWGSPISEIVKCENHIVKGNRIENISNAVRDGGHIYMLGGLKDTVVSENYISDSDDFGGIYFDSGSSGITVEKNVAEKCSNWLFGGEDSKNITVRNNYTDGSGMSFYENSDRNVLYENTTVYENSIWEGEALSIYENSGATCVREWNNIFLPEWRKSLDYKIPRQELLSDGEILIEAEDYTGFYTTSEKEKPTIYNQGFKTVMGDLRQNDMMTYEVEAEEGEYIFEYRYSTGPYNPQTGRIQIKVLVNGEEAIGRTELPKTNCPWSSHIPQQIGQIHLNEGKNTISIKNLYNGFAYDSFKLIKVR